MASSPNPIRSEYRRITPSLVVDGAADALAFYCEVFGATERMRIPGPGGKIAHAELDLGDSVLMVDDAFPEMGSKAPPAGGLDGCPVSLYVYVPDVDATIAQAAERGATVVRAAEDVFYGDRNGFVVDPFGHGWIIASHVEDVPEDEMMRRMESMFAES